MQGLEAFTAATLELVFGVRIHLPAWHFERHDGSWVERHLRIWEAFRPRGDAYLARYGPDPPVDRVCYICGGFGRVPFAECWYCGASPSWHHGRCCPNAPVSTQEAPQ